MLQSFSILILVSALFTYINYRWVKLSNTIALVIFGMAFAMIITAFKNIFPDFHDFFYRLIVDADFKSLLMDGLLSFLLFAGAIHIDIRDFNKERRSIFLFATIGVLISTFLVGGLIFFVAPWVGINIPIVHAFLFGALISPTDPIAVIAILKHINANKRLEMKIEGESLFNDGVGVIVFSGVLLFLGVDHGSTESSVSIQLGELFLKEVIGGLLFGGIIGIIAHTLIKSVKENTELSVILSIAMAMGGYAIAALIGVSGPLSMVVAGLIIGNKLHINYAQDETCHTLRNTWKVLDETLNGVLFVLIGLFMNLLDFNISYLLLGLIAIVIVFISRFFSVFIPNRLLNPEEHKSLRTSVVLTWGGLRGGIALALALSLPHEMASYEIIFFVTYVVVLFSIIFQGLTIGQLVKKIYSEK